MFKISPLPPQLDPALVAKLVRADKRDGALLPENSGAPALWNWRP